jgi:glycosyltransferase involved in cell wall biosynthesis
VKVDPRVKVIHQQNGGVTSARMKGLASSTADWILFVDADDYLYYKATEMLLKQQLLTNADIIIGQSTSNHSEMGSPTESKPYENYNGLDYLRILLNAKRSGNLWGALLKRSYFSNINVPNHIKWAEDLATIIQLVAQAKTISTLNNCIYCYVNNPSSVTKNKKIDVLLSQFEARNCIRDFLEKSGLIHSVYKEMRCCELRWELSALHLLFRVGYTKNNLRKMAWDCLVFNPSLGFFCMRNTSGIKRLCLLISLFSPIFAAWLLWRYGQFRMKTIKRD